MSALAVRPCLKIATANFPPAATSRDFSKPGRGKTQAKLFAAAWQPELIRSKLAVPFRVPRRLRAAFRGRVSSRCGTNRTKTGEKKEGKPPSNRQHASLRSFKLQISNFYTYCWSSFFFFLFFFYWRNRNETLGDWSLKNVAWLSRKREGKLDRTGLVINYG